jgi:hypothetical protein
MNNTTWVQKYGHPLTTNRSAEKWQVIFNLSLSVEDTDSDYRLVNLTKIAGTRNILHIQKIPKTQGHYCF